MVRVDSRCAGARALLLVVLAGCIAFPSDPGLPAPPSGPGKHLLFVGNSLTAFNALPQVLEALADSAGEPLLETGMLANANYSLEDHWNDGRAAATIRKGGWHLVVMQQGPSAAESSRQLLIRYAVRIDSVAREHGATSAMYGVWPSVGRPQDFPRAIESYRLIADSIAGLYFPVGEAWLAAWELNPDMPLYSSDGLHPSLPGTYLAALVMYAILYEKSPVGLPSSFQLRDGRVANIHPVLAATLQEAALRVSVR